MSDICIRLACSEFNYSVSLDCPSEACALACSQVADDGRNGQSRQDTGLWTPSLGGIPEAGLPRPLSSRGSETEGGSQRSRALILTLPVPGQATRGCHLSSVSSSAGGNRFPLGPSEADTGRGIRAGGADPGGNGSEAAVRPRAGGRGREGADARHASESARECVNRPRRGLLVLGPTECLWASKSQESSLSAITLLEELFFL